MRVISGPAAHRPLSWASERATICSMSVSLVLENRAARVGSVDYASHIRDYSGFYGLGVRIVVGVIRRAPVLRRDSQTPP